MQTDWCRTEVRMSDRNIEKVIDIAENVQPADVCNICFENLVENAENVHSRCTSSAFVDGWPRNPHVQFVGNHCLPSLAFNRGPHCRRLR